jgi:hypothetical protein
MATCATTGERGMMVAMSHGLCVCLGVCGETTKNKEESKIVMVSYWVTTKIGINGFYLNLNQNQHGINLE